MRFELYTEAVLAHDLPEHRLRRGDLVKLVDRHVACDGTEGYLIEVFNALGNTLLITAISERDLEPLREDELFCARMLTTA